MSSPETGGVEHQVGERPSNAPNRPPGLRLDSVARRFVQGSSVLEVLRNVTMEVSAGEMVALVGPSGAGKSTLLQIAGLLEPPDEGEVFVAGVPAVDTSDQARTEMRRQQIGFVYQHHHLLREFSAVENLMLPQMISGLPRRDARERAEQLLQMVGLSDRASHRPARLSGGEQQRVAIARALANAPELLLADEPTGNLDPHTADIVFQQLSRLVRGTGVAALIATHNLELAERMDRVVTLEDGMIRELPKRSH